MMDSLRLQELADTPEPDRASLVLNERHSWLLRHQGSFLEAGRAGLLAGSDPAALTAWADEELRKVEHYRARIGAGRGRKFLGEKDSAIRFDRRSDYVSLLIAHDVVHGSAVPMMRRTKEVEIDGEPVVGFYDVVPDSEYDLAVAAFAAKSALLAAQAACVMFGWTPADTSAALLRSLDAT